MDPIYTPHPSCRTSILRLSWVFQVAFFPQVFPPKPCIYLFSAHACCMPCLSHPSVFDHPDDIWWGVQSTQLLFMQSSSFPCCVVPLRPKGPGWPLEWCLSFLDSEATEDEAQRVSVNVMTFFVSMFIFYTAISVYFTKLYVLAFVHILFCSTFQVCLLVIYSVVEEVTCVQFVFCIAFREMCCWSS